MVEKKCLDRIYRKDLDLSLLLILLILLILSKNLADYRNLTLTAGPSM